MEYEPRGFARASSQHHGFPRVLAPIASGGLASIDLAELRDGRRVVLKRVSSVLDDQPRWENLLREEGQLLLQLSHPNLIAVRAAGATDGHPYLALDLVEGADLRQLLASACTRPSLPILAAIFAGALRGLDALHDARSCSGRPLELVHGAPHSRHILVGIDGDVRLIDLTQASGRETSDGELRARRLSPLYLAPEQVERGKSIDRRADLFVLGVCLWECLARQPACAGGIPPVAPTSGQATTAPGPGQAEPSDAFDDVCMRAIDPDRSRRFASAREMLAALLTAATQAGGLATPAEVGGWVAQHHRLRRTHSGLAPRPHQLAAASNSELGAARQAPTLTLALAPHAERGPSALAPRASALALRAPVARAPAPPFDSTYALRAAPLVLVQPCHRATESARPPTPPRAQAGRHDGAGRVPSRAPTDAAGSSKLALEALVRRPLSLGPELTQRGLLLVSALLFLLLGDVALRRRVPWPSSAALSSEFVAQQRPERELQESAATPVRAAVRAAQEPTSPSPAPAVRRPPTAKPKAVTPGAARAVDRQPVSVRASTAATAIASPPARPAASAGEATSELPVNPYDD